MSKPLVHSLKEQHCPADWETFLTLNLSCFKNQFCTPDVRQKQTPLSRSKGQVGRNYWPISWSAHTHTHNMVLSPMEKSQTGSTEKFTLLIFEINKNGLLSHDFASGTKVIGL